MSNILNWDELKFHIETSDNFYELKNRILTELLTKVIILEFNANPNSITSIAKFIKLNRTTCTEMLKYLKIKDKINFISKRPNES